MKRLYLSPTDYRFQDIQLSDESLMQMEKVDSGNLESLTLHDSGNYDWFSDTYFDSTAPNEYEVGVGNSFYRLSKRLIAADEEETPEEEVENSMPDINVSSYEENEEEEEKEEEEIEEEIHLEDKIPNYLVFDVLKQATKEVIAMCGGKIKKAPVPVDIYIRYDNLNEADSHSNESQVALTPYVDIVYTIYEMFLQDMNVYVIIQANRETKDYKFYDWNDIEYKGFYTTKQEAVNYIKSML